MGKHPQPLLEALSLFFVGLGLLAMGITSPFGSVVASRLVLAGGILLMASAIARLIKAWKKR